MGPLRRGPGWGRPAPCLLLVLLVLATLSSAAGTFCDQYFPGVDPAKLKGVSAAKQGGTDYNWAVNLCTPFDPFYQCLGEKAIWVGQQTTDGSCSDMLQCSGFPQVIKDARTGSIVYTFGSDNCKTVQFQHRVAKVMVNCKHGGDLQVTSAIATATPSNGEDYEIYVEVDCGSAPITPYPGAVPGGVPGAQKLKATHGFDFGWLFIIVFLLGVVGYFGGFIGYNMKRKGMSFIESIPHKEFWKDLPLLVWDGMKLTGRGLVGLSNKVRKK